MPSSRIAGTVIGLSFLVPLWLLAGADAPTSPAAPQRESGNQSSQLVGPGSCSARACHGGIEPVPLGDGRTVQQNEFILWTALRDKHTEAYRVLLDDKSKDIERHLKKLANANEVHPETNVLCLSCHVQQPYNSKNLAEELTEEDFKAFGVGCENCHGAAKRWLKLHALPDWRTKPDEKKQALGMYLTKDLAFRASVCVKCHVGGKDADANHDLIAAGHPRLNFEFGAFMANMPRHWSDKNPIEIANKTASFGVQSWAVGQVITAQAALELLAYRADPNAKGLEGATKPWPEFAEYDCFSCHHNLQGDSWRQKPRGDLRRKPGALVWNDWYATVPRSMTARAQLPTDSLDKIATLMSRPSENRQAIAELASKAAAQLNPSLAATTPDRAAVITLLKELYRKNRNNPSWDRDAQIYLALAAAREDDPLVKALVNTLNFGKNFNSPTNDASRVEFDTQLKKLLDIE